MVNTVTDATATSLPSRKSKRQTSPASLECVQTLTPPKGIQPKNKSISKADALLSSYVSEHESRSDSPVWDCTFSHDGTTLATCHGRPDPCIRLWKYRKNENDGNCDGESSWKLVATLRDVEGGSSSKSRTIRSIAFAPTPNNVRKILAAASFDGSVSIWEDFSSESNGKNEYTLKNDDDDAMEGVNVNTSHYSNNSCGWECTAQLEGHDNEVKDVTWNATGTLLASCGRDKSVWIWECFLPGTIGGDGDGSTGFSSGGEGNFECLAVLQAHEGDVKEVAFAPSHDQFGDGDEILLSASYDDTIKVWAEDAGDWYCALTLSNVHTSTIWSISLSPGGVRMISGSADESLAIWRCYTVAEKNEFEDKDGGDGMESDGTWRCVGKLPSAHSGPVYSVDCAPSRAGHGRIVSCGGDDRINIYREVGGSPEAPLFTVDAYAMKAHDGDVNCVKWHPVDGRMIASAGDDGRVNIWKFIM